MDKQEGERMRIKWKGQPYNEHLHLRIERYGRRSNPHVRYLIRMMRKQRRLANIGAVPIDMPLTGGEVVTDYQHGKATGIATNHGQMRLTNFFD